MELQFTNQPPSAAASRSQILSRPTYQSGTASLPATLRETSTARPGYFPSMPENYIQQTQGSVPVSSFVSNPALLPDPPAAGPHSTIAPSSRGSLVATLASVSSHRVIARPTPRRNQKRTVPVAATATASMIDSPPAAGTSQNRRSTRRKRTTCAAASGSTDPPAKKRRGNLKNPPPGSVKTNQSDDNSKEGKSASCCICMDEPKPVDLASISGCDHLFCFDCIEKWAERENTCPLCKVRFTKIDRVNAVRRKGGPKNTKRVKAKDQRSDVVPGAALEGLLASFASSANFPPHRMARLIFSGMGGNPFILPGSAALRARATSIERAQALEDSLFSSDTDEDDESSFLPAGGSFEELFQPGAPFGPRAPGMVVRGGFHTIHPMSFAALGQANRTTSRSYASNMGDRTAGQATNPLEIDDESEEEIEVVHVTQPL